MLLVLQTLTDGTRSQEFEKSKSDLWNTFSLIYLKHLFKDLTFFFSSKKNAQEDLTDTETNAVK